MNFLLRVSARMKDALPQPVSMSSVWHYVSLYVTMPMLRANADAFSRTCSDAAALPAVPCPYFQVAQAVGDDAAQCYLLLQCCYCYFCYSLGLGLGLAMLPCHAAMQ